jgi:hypothetical protein
VLDSWGMQRSSRDPTGARAEETRRTPPGKQAPVSEISVLDHQIIQEKRKRLEQPRQA